MSDPLAPVSAGDFLPLSAATYNALFATARRERARGNGMTGSANTIADSFRGMIEIDIKNDTGATILPFSVLKLNGPFGDPATTPYESQQVPTFIGIAPTASTDIVAITREGGSDDSYVRAIVGGVAVCKINVSDTSHGYASPTSASVAYLASGATGAFPILWKESGTGTKQAMVLMSQGVSAGGSSVDFSAGTSTSITTGAGYLGAGASATASIVGGSNGGIYRGKFSVNTSAFTAPGGPYANFNICKIQVAPSFVNTISSVVLTPCPGPFEGTSEPPNGHLVFVFTNSQSEFTVRSGNSSLSPNMTYSWFYQILEK